MAVFRISATKQPLPAKLHERPNTLNNSGELFLVPRAVLQLRAPDTSGPHVDFRVMHRDAALL